MGIQPMPIFTTLHCWIYAEFTDHRRPRRIHRRIWQPSTILIMYSYIGWLPNWRGVGESSPWMFVGRVNRFRPCKGRTDTWSILGWPQMAMSQNPGSLKKKVPRNSWLMDVYSPNMPTIGYYPPICISTSQCSWGLVPTEHISTVKTQLCLTGLHHELMGYSEWWW